MYATRSPKYLLFLVLVSVALAGKDAEARFISSFSLTAGQEYNDNIFFDESGEHDFVTTVTPTLSLLYQPSLEIGPTFTVNIDPSAQIFARHPELNNFGENLGFDVNYGYRYSPRLTFTFSDRFERRGEDRTGGFGGFGGGGGFGGFGGGGGGLGGGLGGQGGNRLTDSSLDEEDLLSQGDRLENEFAARGQFLYTPNVTLSGGYTWDYITFLDEGGRQTEHGLEVEGVYSRWRQHNLRARYEIRLLKSRDGGRDVLHDFEIGDDFFSSRQIELTPTLTVFASTGIALQTGDEFRIENRLNVEAVKIWRTASFTVGIDRDLTSSEGVSSGPSFTTSFFSQFNIQLTRRLTAFAGADFSLFDTDEADFKTFQTIAGISYWITRWLSANLAYSYRWLDPGSGADNSSSFLSRTKTDSNSIFLSLTAHFDLWPNFGLPRGTTAFPSTTWGGGYGLPSRTRTR